MPTRRKARSSGRRKESTAKKHSKESQDSDRLESTPQQPSRQLWSRLVLALVWIIPVYLSYDAYQQWGFYFFIPLFLRDLRYTPEQWQTLLRNHTVVLIGGPHRGGTTVLWDTLRTHPELSDFGNQRESGVDLSEGTFTQDVYPRFSVGYEPSRGKNEAVGMGRYALADEKDVHWTQDHPKVTPTNQARLLNRFGWYWDVDKPFWLEKSPTNAVLSTFLQSLLNEGNNGWSASKKGFGGGKSVVKFIFISRDPWANSYAHKTMEGVKDTIEVLLNNWIKVHEYMEEDAARLQYVQVIQLEHFDKHAARMIKDMWEWIGLSGPLNELAEEAAEMVRSNQNAKYVRKHCGILARPSAYEHFQHIVHKLNDRVKALTLVDYDLNSSLWNCKDESA